MKNLLVAALLLVSGHAVAQGIEVFYLGAPDCRYCQRWELRSRDAFLASPEGKAVRFVEVRGETLREPIEARHYPPEYQWVFQQVGPSRGVPRFLLAVDRKVVFSAFGLDGYSKRFLPALKDAIARKQAEKT